MGKKQNLAYAVIAVLLAVLIYVQFRTWRDFDWATFWSQTDQVRITHILHAIGLIYLGYVLRAVRWKIFLQPVRRNASTIGLVAPTIIGFTGLALLGRAGELIRPYLIARKEKLPFSSQLGVWAVERIFDIGAFAALMALGIFLPSAMRSTPHPEYYSRFREGGFVLVGLVLGLTLAAWLANRWGDAAGDWLEVRFAHVGPAGSRWSHRVAERVREFGKGLHTIHGPLSLFWLIVVSVGMWWIIAVAYHEVTIAYHQTGDVFGEDPLDIHLLQVLLLMGSSMLGSILQLPGVGGGSQLATIAALEHIFDVPKELAASCGIMLWLVTFVAVVPIGLSLAHVERLSLRKLSEEAQQQEAGTVLPSSPPAA